MEPWGCTYKLKSTFDFQICTLCHTVSPCHLSWLVHSTSAPNVDRKALNLGILPQAANYLDIKGLLDVTCKTVANMIKGKTPEEIRKTFNIKNDFTEEEEAQVPDRGLIII